jgi:hypothetical protein
MCPDLVAQRLQARHCLVTGSPTSLEAPFAAA